MGAGGHAQVMADALLRAAERDAVIAPVGYLDDDPSLIGQNFLGLPVLGALSDVNRIPHDAVIVAIGDNATRQRIFERLQSQGEHFAVARHPHTVVGAGVSIGPGSMICAGVVINPGSVIGANVILNTACTVDHHNRIGDHAHLAPGVHTGGDVTIGAGTLIGIGATVMPQRRVGAWCIVGAGSLVHADLPDNVMAIGIPAKVIRTHEKER